MPVSHYEPFTVIVNHIEFQFSKSLKLLKRGSLRASVWKAIRDTISRQTLIAFDIVSSEHGNSFCVKVRLETTKAED